MLRHAIGHKSREPPQWRVMLMRIRERRWTEVDQDVDPHEEQHPLEPMLHWRDPVDRVRTRRTHRKHLLGDNPSSG